MKYKLYPSFSGMLADISNGKISAECFDDKDSYYFFGCTREAILSTMKQYTKELNSKLQLRILEQLYTADCEGRCYFRNDGGSFEKDQEWFSDTLMVSMEVVKKMCPADMGPMFNIPAMRRVIEQECPNIEFCYYH